MMKQKYKPPIWLYTTCILGIIVLGALGVFLPSYYENMGNCIFKMNEMIFYSGIISGGISGIVTFLVLLISYVQNKSQSLAMQEQYNDEKRLTILPYINALIVTEPHAKPDSGITIHHDKKSTIITFQGKMSIKNIGHGNCFNFSFIKCTIDGIVITDIEYVSSYDGIMKTDTNIEIGQERTFYIIFKMGHDWTQKDAHISLLAEFSDIIGTKYSQEYEINMYEKNMFMYRVHSPKVINDLA